MHSRLNKSLLLIFLLAFTIRLLIGLSIGDGSNSVSMLIAQNIVRGHGYSLGGSQPTAILPPAYPLILAGLIAALQEQNLHTSLAILLALVGAVNASLCAFLSLKIFNRKTALIAGLLYIFIPYLAQKEATTENGFVALGLITGTYLLLKGWRNKNIIFIFLSGIATSFACLVRSDIMLIPIFIFIGLLISRYRSKKTTKWHISAAMIFILSFTMGLTPWLIRNKRVFGGLYFGQYNFWWNFYVSNHRQSFQIYPYLSLDNFAFMVPHTTPPRLNNEAEYAQWLRQQALSEIQKIPPKEIIKRDLKKLVYLWDIRLVPYTDRIGNDPVTHKTLDRPRSLFKNLLFSIPYLFLLIFAFMGSWQERKRKRLLFFMAGFLTFFSIPYMVVRAFSKYTTPVYFILIIMASGGIVSLIQRATKSHLTDSQS